VIEPLALYAALAAYWYVFVRQQWDSVPDL
jgi:hypothetical protein